MDLLRTALQLFQTETSRSGLLSDFFRQKWIASDRFGHTVYRQTGNSHNENTTLYVSPYFTVGKNGAEFTKHYYAGSQRLVSKLGNGRFNNHFRPGVYGLTAGGVNYIERMQSITQSREEYIRNLGIAPGPPHMKGIYADPAYSGISYPDGGTPANTYVPAGWPRKVIPLQDKDPNGPPGAPIQYYPPMSNETAEPGFAYEGAGQIEESGRYFYHGDHLGSTSFVTDARGRVSQYVAYMPYGEALFEEHSNTRDMPYLFNSKERDEETGLYYYGARYLDTETAVWYGVDPLVMEYPDYSPYIYCFNNPINFIDPNGMLPSTFINPNGDIMETRDDGDRNIYLVHDPDNWDRTKKGLHVVGQTPEPNTLEQFVGQNIRNDKVINYLYSEEKRTDSEFLLAWRTVERLEKFADEIKNQKRQIELLKQLQELRSQQLALHKETLKKKELQLNEHKRSNAKHTKWVLPRIFVRALLSFYPYLYIDDGTFNDSLFPESILNDIDRVYDEKERKIHEKYK
jgi:RHS repeat-associated protein